MSIFHGDRDRATSWRLKTRTLSFGHVPLVMGIVNVTPDSFSDGGRFLSTASAIAHARQLVADGADLLDIGGESTRPYSTPVSADEELKRVVPVIEALCRDRTVPVSIDTSKAAVAEAALAAGAEIVNDVTGLTGDDAMLSVVKPHRPGVCVMHMRGTPQTMQDAPKYQNVTTEIRAYLIDRLDALLAAGIESDQICLDPGLGFGKTHQHNVDLIAHTKEFVSLGQPILIGHSRKGFIAKILENKTVNRDFGTAAVACVVAQAGAQIVRVHDVAGVKQALSVFAAVGGIAGRTITFPASS